MISDHSISSNSTFKIHLNVKSFNIFLTLSSTMILLYCLLLGWYERIRVMWFQLQGLLENRLTLSRKKNILHFCSKLLFWKKQLNSIKSLSRQVSTLKQKILKYAFSNKHLKLIISDGRSLFCHSIRNLHGDILE